MNQHCCEEMNLHLNANEVAIVYLPEFREYGIKILDGGSSFQEIHYCPWCGQKLPESLRLRWFEIMAELGLEWDDEHIPPQYLSEAWWRETELLDKLHKINKENPIEFDLPERLNLPMP